MKQVGEAGKRNKYETKAVVAYDHRVSQNPLTGLRLIILHTCFFTWTHSIESVKAGRQQR